MDIVDKAYIDKQIKELTRLILSSSTGFIKSKEGRLKIEKSETSKNRVNRSMSRSRDINL